MSAMLANWFGTPFPDWFGSWWTFVGIVAVVVVVAWQVFRSLRKWKEPPRGHDPDAAQAEDDLWWFTYRHMPE
jgi:hypothetical protein